MDPQHRVFLECAWTALEDAGYDATAVPGPHRRLRRLGHEHLPDRATCSTTRRRMRVAGPACPRCGCNDRDFLATRVAYKLDLTGPSVDRADRLLDLARRRPPGLPEPAGRRVRHGAGRRRRRSASPQKAGYLLPGGRASSRPTATAGPSTRSAAGTVFGNGVGVVVLKRLADALRRRRHHPRRHPRLGHQQRRRRRRSASPRRASTARPRSSRRRWPWPRSSPDTISYVEAHGTATALGDPIEVAALTQAFRRRHRRARASARSAR